MKISLSVAKAMPLFVVFSQQLDGYEKVIKGPDGKNKSVPCLFELGAARLDIVKNANRVKAIIDDFETIRVSVVKRLAGDKGQITQKDDPEAFAQFLAEMTPLQEKETDVELIPLSRAALKLDVNDIQIGALMLLDQYGLVTD